MGRLSGTAAIELPLPIADVWPTVADVGSIGEWQSTIGDVAVLERDAEGRATRTSIEIDAKVKVLRSTLRVSYEEPRRVSWTQEQGDLSSLVGSWTLEDLGDGRTGATYALEIDPGFGLSMFIRGEAEQKLRRKLVLVRPDELRARLGA